MSRLLSFGPLVVLAAAVALSVALATFTTPGRAGEDVCLSEPMAFADKNVTGCLSASDSDGLMDRAIKLGDNVGDGGVELSHPSDSSQQREVRTCREYETAIGQGWHALTTVDMTMESFFKRECGLVHAIAHARRARNSFVSAPRVGIANLELVSAKTIGALVPGADGSLRSLVDAGVVTVEAHGARELRLATKDQFAVLTELARGDFDGDGYEDVFALLAVHARGGTMRAYQTLLLSRHSADGMFEVRPVSLDG